MKHITIKVTGHVQGVYFRVSALEKANELGLKGTVRNDADGGVSLEAEGSEEQIELLIQWCRQGPSRAKIENVTSREGKFVGYKSFEIVR
ncbi:MAG TPA: acylphosphatase [Cyclobacteriaceae bacterium]|nr:acylphosphatase [Cyclobacteriaceae bacterium]